MLSQRGSRPRVDGALRLHDAKTVAEPTVIVVDQCEQALRDNVSPLAVEAVAQAVVCAFEHIGVETLARMCGCSRRTLSRRLASDALPSPRGIIAWGKILVAAQLLAEGDRSIEAVAHQLGLSDASGLVHLYQHHAGLTPGQIRRSGGVVVALSLLGGVPTNVAARPRSLKIS